MGAAAELGKNPVSKYQVQPEYGDEQTGAGRDCRTRPARPNFQARTRTWKYIPCSADHEQDLDHLTRLIHTLAICVTIHDDPPCLACFFCVNLYQIWGRSDFTNPMPLLLTCHHDRPPKESQNIQLSLCPDRNWVANVDHECGVRQSGRRTRVAVAPHKPSNTS